MKRRLLCFIMLLALIGSARGQTAYSYRYWFDDNDTNVRTGSANGETTIEFDVGSLTKGAMHALHFQARDARNKWGAVHTTYFFYTRSKTDNVSARYWFDNDSIMQTAPKTNGLIEFNISKLGCGVHALHFQMYDASGSPSPVQTAYFYKGAKGNKARYWFDNETNMRTTSAVSGLADLDISGLGFGIHALHYQLFSANGEASPVHTQYFNKKNDLDFSSLTCRLWIDDKEDLAMSFGLTEDIILEAKDLAAGTHELHVVLLNAAGEELAEKTTTFKVDALRSITITLQAPIATFSNEHGLDFGGIEGIKAYTATGFHKWTGNVLMSRVDDVPAGEGLLLVGEPGTYEVPVLQSYSYYANLLVGTPEATVIAQTADGYDNYLLSFRDDEAGFLLAEDGSTLAAGKAYLHVPSNEAAGTRKLKISFDDNPDAIDTPSGETEEGAAVYNLAGQRLNKLQKGINIKSGRKVIVK